MTEASPASSTTPNPGSASADAPRGPYAGSPQAAPQGTPSPATRAAASLPRLPGSGSDAGGAAPAERSSTGLTARTAAALCYASAWIGGLAFLAFERRSRFVRFHAWQSVLALGGLFLLGAGLWTLGMMMVFVSTGAFRTLAWLSQVAWVAMGVVWLVMVVTAFTGRRVMLPIVGKKAEQWSVLPGR